jgi:excisionase family DNA binding protein
MICQYGKQLQKKGFSAMQDQCDLLTVNEAAAFLRLQQSTVRRWVLEKKMPYLKLGRRVFLRRSDLDALLASSLVPARATR